MCYVNVGVCVGRAEARREGPGVPRGAMVNLGGTDERWWCRGMEAYEGRPTCMGEGTGMQDTGGTWDEDADVGGMAHVNEGWGKAWLGCMERHSLCGEARPGCVVRHGQR